MIKRLPAYILLAAATGLPVVAVGGDYAIGTHVFNTATHHMNAGMSRMLMMQTMMAQQQANLLNQAIQSAAINPMDDNRRQNLQNSLNNAAAAKTTVESSFKSGAISSGVGTVQSLLSGSVDPHAADRNNPNTKALDQEAKRLLDQLRNGNGSTDGNPAGANAGGLSTQSGSASSASGLAGSVELKALQQIPKDQNVSDTKTTTDGATQYTAAANGSAQGGISKLDELQTVLTNASDKNGKNPVGPNATLLSDKNGLADGEAPNANAGAKGAAAQTQSHDLTAGYGNSLSARLAGFFGDSANGEGGRMGQFFSPVASLLEWAGLLGKTTEKSRGRHRSLYRYHFDASPAALVIPLIFFALLIWAVSKVRAAIDKRRGNGVFAEELRRAA